MIRIARTRDCLRVFFGWCRLSLLFHVSVYYLGLKRKDVKKECIQIALFVFL